MSTDPTLMAADFAAVLCGVSRSVLRTALGRTVDLQVASEADLAPAAPGQDESLDLHARLAGCVEGIATLRIPRRVAGQLADLMMMGKGDVEWNADLIDGVRELGGQIVGALAANQSERWSCRVESGGVDVREQAAPSGAAGAVEQLLELDVQGWPPVGVLLRMDGPLLRSLVQRDLDLAQASGGPVPEEFLDALGSARRPSASSPPPSEAGGLVRVTTDSPAIQRLLDIPIDVAIELGKTQLSIRRVLEIGPGSIIELDRMAGEPVDLVVNDTVIARGEVVVVEENFGIRLTHLVSREERIRSL